jgi:hypothetical protein
MATEPGGIRLQYRHRRLSQIDAPLSRSSWQQARAEYGHQRDLGLDPAAPPDRPPVPIEHDDKH